MEIALLASTNDLVRDVTAYSLLPEVDVIMMDLTQEAVILIHASRRDQVSTTEIVKLKHMCITCSLREALLPKLAKLSAHLEQVVVALPVCVELLNVAPALAEAIIDGGAEESLTLRSATYTSELSEISAGLLQHQPLADLGLSLFDGDDRCLGEVQATNLGYADVVLTMGTDSAVADVVSHLRPSQTTTVSSLPELTTSLLFGATHDADAAIAGIHPATTRAWSGRNDRGVWTLDLHSTRPFHPARLREKIANIAPLGTCVRGCFWIPGRTDEVSGIEASGGQVTIGSAGPWVETPFVHVIVVGVDDVASRWEVKQAFAESLMTRAEFEETMSNARPNRAHDTLDDWFSE